MILHVIGAFVAGGAEKFVVDLLRTLQDQKHSVGLLALSRKQDSAGRKMCSLLNASDVPFWHGPTDRVRARSLLWYTAQLSRIKPDIVHLHTPNTELTHYLARNVFRRKHTIIRTIHNTKIPANRWYWRAIRKNPAKISIACSKAVEKKWTSLLNVNIITIENGVNFDWPVQDRTLQTEYRTKLSISRDLFHMVNIGQQAGDALVNLQKGQDILINAWKKGRLGAYGCQLHLFGNGNLRSQLEQLAGKDQSIRFQGVRSDIHDWLIAADCLVMPSRHEGLPIAAIEAMGTGLPCLFSNIQSLKELKAPSVLWSEVNDVEALKSNLLEIRKNKITISQNQTEDIRQRFGIKRTAARYSKLYS
jgi:glycosyltransferase involved in cell wall biosynthesis